MKKYLLSIILTLIPLTLCAWGVGMSGVSLLSGSEEGGGDTTKPTIDSASVNTAGSQLTINFSESVSRGAGFSASQFTFNDGSANALTYSSGDPGTSWVLTTASTVHSGDTCTLAFDGGATSILDGAGNYADDDASITVTNNSTQSAGCTGDYGNTATTDTGIMGEGSVQCFAKQITGACNATSASMTLRLQYHGVTTGFHYSFCIWSDSAGEPGTLLAHVDGTHTSDVIAAVTETITQATGATTFWIGIYAEASVGWAYSSTTGGTARSRYNCTNAWNSPPTSWGGTGSGTEDSDYNAYNFEGYITF